VINAGNITRAITSLGRLLLFDASGCFCQRTALSQPRIPPAQGHIFKGWDWKAADG
jgi:hypothetical protein